MVLAAQAWEEAAGLSRTVAVVGSRGVLVELESLAVPHAPPSPQGGSGDGGGRAPARPPQFRATGFDPQ